MAESENNIVNEEVVTEEKVEKENYTDPISESTTSFDGNQLLQKAQAIFQKKKKEVIGALVILAVALVAYFGYSYYNSLPKSIINEVKVDFTGYDESGNLIYNSDEIASLVEEAVYKKAGLDKDQAKALTKDDPVAYSMLAQDRKLSLKLMKAESMLKTIHYEFNKTNNLKNGEEVTFTITTSSKNSPIKAEKKAFKVQNLKEYEKVSAENLLKEVTVTFSGFNGYGTVSFGNSIKNYFQLNSSNSYSNLKNGDKITLTVNDSYIKTLKESGKIIDNKNVDITVSGLKEIKDIKNFEDLIKKNDDYVKSEHKNDSYDTYTIESQGSYMRINVNNYDKGSISLVTIYKVTKTDSKDNKSVKYKYYGYSAYLLKDGNLDIDTASKISDHWGTKDLEGLRAQLSSDGYKVYEGKKE
ncbi:hypothetical protein [uncultured Granulicatella sp.]|uniref:hypothetical protein n=1 Tax=uncultured Granulicatella sp. TaxID=316089 RepID=UPI0028E50DD7|nr:hypothetical protein [uncultured Granulicatella sp.]